MWKDHIHWQYMQEEEIEPGFKEYYLEGEKKDQKNW